METARDYLRTLTSVPAQDLQPFIAAMRKDQPSFRFHSSVIVENAKLCTVLPNWTGCLFRKCDFERVFVITSDSKLFHNYFETLKNLNRKYVYHYELLDAMNRAMRLCELHLNVSTMHRFYCDFDHYLNPITVLLFNECIALLIDLLLRELRLKNHKTYYTYTGLHMLARQGKDESRVLYDRIIIPVKTRLEMHSKFLATQLAEICLQFFGKSINFNEELQSPCMTYIGKSFDCPPFLFNDRTFPIVNRFSVAEVQQLLQRRFDRMKGNPKNEELIYSQATPQSTTPSETSKTPSTITLTNSTSHTAAHTVHKNSNTQPRKKPKIIMDQDEDYGPFRTKHSALAMFTQPIECELTPIVTSISVLF